MQTEPGTLSAARCGELFLTIAEETYRLTRNAVHTLLFYGQSVPLVRRREIVHPDGSIVAETIIDGYISVHPSGRAVIAATRAGHFVIPNACFREVARGEALLALLFPVAPDHDGEVL